MKVKDYSKFLSRVSNARKPSPIRALAPIMARPDIISLGGGLPNPAMFPFEGISMRLKSGEELHLTEGEVKQALQYSATPGLPPLVQWIKQLQQTEHSPPYEEWDVCMSTGSQDSLSKALEMLIGESGSILVDQPCYSGTLAFAQPLADNIIGVDTDQHGLIPSQLRHAIRSAPHHQRPKALYTVPTGQNPSGSTLSQARKREIYDICCEEDLLILEDDPYWFLNFGLESAPQPDAYYDQLRKQNPSFFHLDEEGRVLRFDSFSKVLSSGVRLGWVTGPKPLVERINLHMQATSLHTSGVSQALVSKLLNHWGMDGFQRHVRQVASFYQQRRDDLISAAEMHLTGLASWDTPEAGMFLWLKLHGVEDTKALIEEKALDAKVVLLPGQAFSPNDEPSPYVRAAFSVASVEDMNVAFQRLARLVREHGDS